MIRLLKIIVTLALVWSIYWFAAGYGVRHAITNWFDTRQQQGWHAEFVDIGTGGYPRRHQTRLVGPGLADPQTGTAWQADWMQFDSPAIWPGHQRVTFPDTAQRLSYFDQTLTILPTGMVADMRLRPGARLQLETMALTSGGWQVTKGTDTLIAASALTLSMQQTETPDIYQFDIDAPEFTPGPELRRLMRSSDSLPETFETLRLDMQVDFSAPWDLSALETARPQPQHIDLRLVEVRWGGLRLLAAGKLDVDAQGIPTGAMTIKADNWREMLAMAAAAGTIPAKVMDPAERVLNLLAGMSGNPNALDVQLNFRDGYVAFGPFPLGPAPRLILR